jgi:hypothetical protein
LKNLLRYLAGSILIVFLCFSLNGCTGGSGGDAWRYDPGIPDQVTGLQAEPGNSLVTLSWNGNPLATSYNIYYVSSLTAGQVTKENGIKLTATKADWVITNLSNNITYHFIVTAINQDGESMESVQVSSTPRPISNEDLQGTWYFHTLVTSPNQAEAGWERGTLTVTLNGNGEGSAEISDYEVSNPDGGSDTPQPPSGFIITTDGNGALAVTGNQSWVDFHGSIGSRKNMMIACFSPTLQSRAITIFQKKRKTSDYNVDDIGGTGSGQNPNDATLQGNGPTRFTYHQLYSGSNTEWEYSNAKIGRKGSWQDQYKDVIYWDYSTPTFKVMNFDFFWKATALGIDQDGLVTEYWNFDNVVDTSRNIYSYNTLIPKQPHQVLFTGRMTDDKTVIVGVSTRTDAYGENPQYFLRIIQLCFIPTDQSLPQPTLYDLAGTYHFNKLGYKASSNGGSGAASWTYGAMNITSSGSVNISESGYSSGPPGSYNFTLSYYPDPNPESKAYRDFSTFTTPSSDGYTHYHDTNGTLLHNYYDFNSNGTGVDINDPSTWRAMQDVYSPIGISPYYFNEHASLSYNGDMFVMTTTDSSGYSMLIGLK